MHPTAIRALCQERGWKRSRLVLELREIARRRGFGELPGDDDLKRMIRFWIAGRRRLSPMYAELFTVAFGVTFVAGKPDDDGACGDGRTHADDVTAELAERLAAARKVDAGLVALFEDQTDSFRALDRRLGASRLLAQTEAHLGQMSELLTYSLPGECRSTLAAAAAEAAALAGWQALDLGDPAKAWLLHETAKTAAQHSGSSSILAHVTAQQAYCLLDLERTDEALALVRHAREEADSRIPDLLRSWLWAAEAEALAATGGEPEARSAMETASRLLPASPIDGALPFVFLDDIHLGRWRGHCLARLGAAEAVGDLVGALTRLDSTFTRAAASLRCDLALAYSIRGEHDAAREEARKANELAVRTASARQRRRITRLLSSGQVDRHSR